MTATGWLGKRAREANADQPNPGGFAPPVPVPFGGRHPAQMADHLESIKAQLRAAIAANEPAAFAAEQRVQAQQPDLPTQPADGAGPSNVAALNSANREFQRVRQGFELCAAARQTMEDMEAEAALRGYDLARIMRPGGERVGADRRAAAMRAALMRDQPPAAQRPPWHLPAPPPPGGVAAPAIAAAAVHPPHAPNGVLDLMGALGDAEDDWADELLGEEGPLRREPAGRDPVGARGVDRGRNDVHAQMAGREWRRVLAAERLERLRGRAADELNVAPPPPRVPPRPPARPAVGVAPDEAAAAVDLHDSAAGGSIKCPLCGTALPLHLSNDAVNAHLDQCLGQDRP